MPEKPPFKPNVFRIRWEYNGAESELLATANREDQTVTVTFPGNQTATMDVVAARVTQVMLNHVAYCVLEPDGPLLPEIEAQGPRGGWHEVYRPLR